MNARNTDGSIDFDAVPYSALRDVLTGSAQVGDVIEYTDRTKLLRLSLEPNMWEIVVNEKAYETVNASHYAGTRQLANHIAAIERSLPEDWGVEDVINTDLDTHDRVHLPSR